MPAEAGTEPEQAAGSGDCEPLALQAQPAASGPRRSARGASKGRWKALNSRPGEELRTTVSSINVTLYSQTRGAWGHAGAKEFAQVFGSLLKF